MKSLSLKAYRQLAPYQVPSYYKLCAISKAAGMLQNYRKLRRKGRSVKEPYARKLQLVTCYGFKIKNGQLLLPTRHHQHIRIFLNAHTTSTIWQAGLTPRSVTLTENWLAITYSKETVPIHPRGVIGLDRNLDNVTSAATDGSIQRINLTEATQIKALYREIKSHMKRNDHRVRQRVFAKYGERQRNRVQQLLH